MKNSAVVLTRNEEKNIKECLESISFCDEVIVVDDDSTDKTLNIAKKMGAKTFSRGMNENYGKQCNYGLKKASGDWIFFIDADERVSKKLREEIINKLSNREIVKQYSGFSVKRKDKLLDKWLRFGEVGTFRSIRLVKKGSGKWMRRVHVWFKLKGSVGKLKNPLQHFPHPTLNEFIRSINRWSSWHARANNEEGKKSNLFKIILFPVFKFFQNYIFRLGFLDGMHGFIHALLMSFHSFLAWSTLWINEQKN